MANEENNLDNDDISRLLGSLKQIDPPGDFDVRVRARIAQGRPEVGHSWFPLPARVTAALLAVLAAGYLGFTTYYPTSNAPQQASVVPMPPPPQVAEDPAPKAAAPAPINAAREPVASTQPSGGTGPAKIAEASKPKSSDKEQGGGSIDFSSSEGRRILPRGFNANPKSAANVSTSQQGGIPINDVLKQLGLDAVSEDAGWRVRSVGGQAERSGIKAGDVIEAINDRSLIKRTSLGGMVSGKTLRIRRDGKAIEITLAP